MCKIVLYYGDKPINHSNTYVVSGSIVVKYACNDLPLR